MSWLQRLAKFFDIPSQEEWRRGITLSTAEAYEIHGIRDLGRLILAIDATISRGCVLYLEGSGQPEHILRFLTTHAAPKQSAVRPETIWPRKRTFHVAIEGTNLQELAQLAGTVDVPDLCEHMAAYCGDKMLVLAPDVTDNPVWVHRDIGPDAVRRFVEIAGGRQPEGE